MKIKGLTQDNYLINNPITIDIEENNANTCYVKLINKYTQNSNIISLYTPPNGKMTYNLSPILKAMFQLPLEDTKYNTSRFINSNIADFELMFYNNDNQITRANIITKTFIRGGYYDYQKDISLPQGKLLSPIDVVPYWDNYPVAEYILKHSTDDILTRKPRTIYKNVKIDTFKNGKRQINRNCKGAYIKFLNSLGGYSYWLFENKKEIRNAKSTFQIDNINKIFDNGVEISNELEVTSRVPIEYIPLINDLIHSPDIYIYEAYKGSYRPTFKRIYIANNKIELNDFQQVQEVTINLKRFISYTPKI